MTSENEKNRLPLARENGSALVGTASTNISEILETKGLAAPSETDYNILSGLPQLDVEVSSKFAPKRTRAQSLAQVYDALDLPRRADRVADCGSFLEFHVFDDVGAKLHAANFCRDRFCPLCTWRRSLKIFGQTSAIMDLVDREKYSFLFLTLTIRNCTAQDLNKTVQILYDGWRNLYHENRKFKKACAGSFRSLEVTVNHKADTYHPHLHIILAVPKAYFCRSSGLYISQAEYVKMWRSACGLTYDPIVDVRRVRPKDLSSDAAADPGSDAYKMAEKSAVAEAAKYATKDSDYLNGSLDENARTLQALLHALTGRRLCAYTGIFQKIRKQLNLDDPESGDLIHTDPNEEIRDDLKYLIVRFSWRSGVYFKTEVTHNEQ